MSLSLVPPANDDAVILRQSRRICGCPCHSNPYTRFRTMLRMPSKGYFTYIVASRSHTLYIGVTSDLRKRVFQHKWKEHDGFTARYNCDRLVWFEVYEDVVRAIRREKELKGWRRARKIALIELANVTWEDLSQSWYEYEPADYRRASDRMNT